MELLSTDFSFFNNNTNTNSSMDVNSNNDNTTNSVYEHIENIADLMNMYYVPVLVFCGGFGNIFALIVFSRTKLSKLSSSYYLSALAISDTCFLFGLFFQWLNLLNFHIYNRPYFCQFFTFFSNLACFCSAWFVVAFTVERFIAIMYPFRRQVICTIRRAKMTLGIVILLGIFHCVPFGIYSTPISMDSVSICDIRSELTDKVTLLNYWDSIVVFAIPFAIIAVVNTFTGCIVWKFAGTRRMLTMNYHHHHQRHNNSNNTNNDNNTNTSEINAKMSDDNTNMKQQHVVLDNEQHVLTLGRRACKPTNTTTTTTTTTTTATASTTTDLDSALPTAERAAIILRLRATRQRNKALNSQMKITRMLMIVSTVFIVLNLPSTLVRIKTYWETQSSANERSTVLLQYVFNLLFMTNFGINFPLYCLSGQNFRKAVLNMIWPNYVHNNNHNTCSLRILSQRRRQHNRGNSNLMD